MLLNLNHTSSTMKSTYLLFIILFLTLSQAFADPLKSALKHLEKRKYNKLEKTLNKALAKDSLNPGAKYIYSLLFLRDDYAHSSVDTANIYIKQALNEFSLVDEKKLKKLLKLNINQEEMLSHKAVVDSLGYLLASEVHTVASYNSFLLKHPEAREVPKAIKERDDIAFAQAQKLNTYEAYMKFIQTYPDADQVRDAKELYDILLFEKKTSDRKLSSYIDFLKEHPKTPYRQQAEKNIFEIATAGNEPSSYAYLVRNFPLSAYSRKAVSYLYHAYTQKNTREQFLQKFPDIPYKDSIEALIPLQKYALFPIYEQEKYGFMDTQGTLILEPSFGAILEDYSCQAIYDDYLVVEGSGKMIIGRNGYLIHNEDFDEVEDLGFGILKIKIDDQYLLKHKGGFQVMDTLYDDFSLLKDRFIVFKDGEKVGLASLNGKILFNPQFDEVFTEGDFIVFEKQKALAIANTQQLLDVANNIPLQLEFKYEDIFPVKENLLHVIGPEIEAVLHPDMKVVVPEDHHEITPFNLGWVIQKDGRYKIYDEKMMAVSDENYDKIINNKSWLALKKNLKWGIINNKISIFPEYIYDSVRILTPHVALLIQEQGTSALFSNGETISLGNSQDKIQILKPTIMSGSIDTTANEFMMLTNKSNFRRIFDNTGKEIISGFYNNVSYLGPNLILLDKNNKKGLADGTGKIVLPIKYDGIGNYNNGYISTLTGTRFGIFNSAKIININPEYDLSLQPYNENLLIATKNQKAGLIDLSGKKLTSFIFDQLLYWTDSVALVKNKDKFSLFHLYKNEITYDGIDEIKYIRQDANENILTILKNNNYGILSNKKGEVIPPLYSDIVNMGSVEEPVYFSEKNVEEAQIVIAIYFNDKGEMIRRQAFTPEEYEKIYCE